MSVFSIRAYQPKDLAALYDICLKTGFAGQDATHLYMNPKAPGHLYVGPYVTLGPAFAFVLEDEQGVCGYVLGALDTQTFEVRVLKEWLPPLQQLYPDPPGDKKTWTPDEKIYHLIHHFELTVQETLKRYPSHLHIDVLPRAQRQGNGTHLMYTLLDALKKQGSSAVHLGMNPNNHRALNFYKKIGFHEIAGDDLPEDDLFLGLVL